MPSCANRLPAVKSRALRRADIEEVATAVAETYRLFHGLNDFLTSGGFRPLEELLLGNSFSGIISEFLVKNIARAPVTLEAILIDDQRCQLWNRVGGDSIELWI